MKVSETVFLKRIRYRHLFVYGLDRRLGFQTSKSLVCKSESSGSKSESSGSKSESTKTGLESKSELEYYKSGNRSKLRVSSCTYLRSNPQGWPKKVSNYHIIYTKSY